MQGKKLFPKIQLLLLATVFFIFQRCGTSDQLTTNISPYDPVGLSFGAPQSYTIINDTTICLHADGGTDKIDEAKRISIQVYDGTTDASFSEQDTAVETASDSSWHADVFVSVPQGNRNVFISVSLIIGEKQIASSIFVHGSLFEHKLYGQKIKTALFSNDCELSLPARCLISSDSFPALPPYKKYLDADSVRFDTIQCNNVNVPMLFPLFPDTTLYAQAYNVRLPYSLEKSCSSTQQLYDALVYVNRQRKPHVPDSVARINLEMFWLRAGDKTFDKARELMRIYYNRVRLADRYFSSYKEGWKTDRGMIFVVFGLPDEIHEDSEGEYWIYYSNGDGEDVQFDFERLTESPVPNDFSLKRGLQYEHVWKTAVEKWGKGQIFRVVE